MVLGEGDAFRDFSTYIVGATLLEKIMEVESFENHRFIEENRRGQARLSAFLDCSR